MTSEREYGEPTRIYEASYPPFRDWDKEATLTVLGTDHLPDEVVAQPVSVGIWCGTLVDSPRKGWFAFGLNIGGRENPKLSDEEKEYVIAMLHWAERRIVEGNLSGGES